MRIPEQTPTSCKVLTNCLALEEGLYRFFMHTAWCCLCRLSRSPTAVSLISFTAGLPSCNDCILLIFFCYFAAQMPFEKTIVVDGRGHLLGRLASVVAKELLLGCVGILVVGTLLHVFSVFCAQDMRKYTQLLASSGIEPAAAAFAACLCGTAGCRVLVMRASKAVTCDFFHTAFELAASFASFTCLQPACCRCALRGAEPQRQPPPQQAEVDGASQPQEQH